MTTKDQERAALAKVRKIVTDLGENSYLGSAFDGAFELAEQNIDCDFAFTTREYIDRAHEVDAAQHEASQRRDTDTKRMELDLINANSALDHLRTQLSEVRNREDGLSEAWVESQKAIAAKDAEIVHLKAKLYDLLIQGA